MINWRYNDNQSEYKFKPMYVSCQADINSRGPLKRFAYFNYRRNVGEESHRLESDVVSNSTPAGILEDPEPSTHSALYKNLIVALSALTVVLLLSCMYLLLGKLRGVKNATKDESLVKEERQPGDGGDNSSGLALSVRNVSVRNADRIE
ncbi:hypothetical protein HOLleu_38859 [Holothuria leucospilota]|uniref:Uncharacterized protein n=1 Tax=Holothuria leucospilota TaxID=206669 RepID=A0A9Q0YEY3_HOLLE|nr:hypothetical protein HOLleu_38859 [Holothuria leucospilota]